MVKDNRIDLMEGYIKEFSQKISENISEPNFVKKLAEEIVKYSDEIVRLKNNPKSDSEHFVNISSLV